MKYLLITFFIIIVSHSAGFSQVYDPYTYQDIEPKPALSEKFFFGGGIGLQFGTFSVIRLTPEIGIRPIEMFEFGIGAYYLYSKSFYWNISGHVYGGNVFGRLYVYQDIYIQGEYEILNIKDFDYSTSSYTGERIFVPGILGGVGFRQKVGKRSAILSSIMYNFTITDKTPYNNPIFRISFIY